MKKNFPAMAEVGMKGRPAGPGRDEFSSPDLSSHPPIPSQLLHPPSEVRISRFGQILTSLGRFRVLCVVFLLIFFMN